jgi:hypothetical protein
MPNKRSPKHGICKICGILTDWNREYCPRCFKTSPQYKKNNNRLRKQHIKQYYRVMQNKEQYKVKVVSTQALKSTLRPSANTGKQKDRKESEANPGATDCLLSKPVRTCKSGKPNAVRRDIRITMPNTESCSSVRN